jgi:hypothetical protein
VAHQGRRLLLGLEPGHDLVGVEADLDDRQRDAPPDRPVLPGDRVDAMALYNRATRVRRSPEPGRPDDVPSHEGQARNLGVHGDLLVAFGECDPAISDFCQGRELIDRLADEQPAKHAYASKLARLERRIGVAHKKAGRAGEAAAALRRSVEILSRQEPASPADLESLAASQARLAFLVGAPGCNPSPAECDLAAEAAMAALRRASAADYRDLLCVKNRDDFNALRSRPGYRLLLLDLAKPVDPFARP